MVPCESRRAAHWSATGSAGRDRFGDIAASPPQTDPPSPARARARRGSGRSSAGGARRGRGGRAPRNVRASNSPCAARSRSRERPGRPTPSTGRGLPWRRSRPPRSTATGIAADDRLGRAGQARAAACCRRRAHGPAGRRARRTARLIPQSEARRMFMRSTRARLATTTETVAAVEDQLVQALALEGGQLLRIVEPVGIAPALEHHRRDHHRPGERPAPGLVDAGDQPRALPLRPPLEAVGRRPERRQLDEGRRIGFRAGHAPRLVDAAARGKRPIAAITAIQTRSASQP